MNTFISEKLNSRATLLRTIAIALVVISFVFSNFATLQADATDISVSKAFHEDVTDMLSSYATYKEGWDTSKFLAESWSSGSNTYERQTGYQYDYYKDLLTTTGKYLGFSDDWFETLSNSTSYSHYYSSSGTGNSIVEVALSQLGESESPLGSNNVKYNTWYYGRSVSGSAYPWCVVFVVWCADQCGYVDSGLFSKIAYTPTLVNYFVNTMGFEKYNSNGNYQPVAGDIACRQDGEHTCLVEYSDSSGWVSIDGNYGDKVTEVSHSYNSGEFWFIHVEYPGIEDGGDVYSRAETIYDYLTVNLSSNPLVAGAVLANILVESGCNPTALNTSDGGYGICQWTFGRATALEDWCDENGKDYTSLDGQLAYFTYEVTEGAFASLWNSVQNKYSALSISLSNLKSATTEWRWKYEAYPGISDYSSLTSTQQAICEWPNTHTENKGLGGSYTFTETVWHLFVNE